MAVKIDWEKVDELLEAGCDGTEICAHLGIHYNTLNNKCEKEKKYKFCDYKALKRAKGDSILRNRQYKTALEGNVPMQIWLGKQRLEQSDKQQVKQETKQENTYNFDNLTTEQLEQLAKILTASHTEADTSGTGKA